MVSAGHVGGTRGSGIVSHAADVLDMSVVCGMRSPASKTALQMYRTG